MMRAMVFLVMLGWSYPVPCAATIVNTLRGFATDEPGWSGSVEGSFSLTGGNTEVRSLGAGGRVQWQGERHRLRLLGAGQRTKGGGNKLEESEMAHLRHNRRMVPRVFSLAFVQWQRNPFQRLTSRFLVGAGARFDLARIERSQVSVGVAHMVEVERIQDVSGHETDHRLSSFLALHHLLREGVRLEATAFGQPRWTRWSDVRATAQGTLRVELGGGLELVVGGQWQYDAQPPEDVERSDWGVATGLSYEL